ncbi:MAG: 5-formyltetrahydrofolate cyclo-ligase [Alphaproteobacteria bacterium]|nr:5-formyltetrahydrofolate cyclo-ligase [Alphaproteobacteria bacterium]
MPSPKQILRARMKGERRAAARARPDAAENAARHAARNFLSAIDVPGDAIVSLYYPIKDELDTEPLAAALSERGTMIALPVVGAKNQPLIFRAYQPGDELIAGAYGEQVPTEDARQVRPAIIIAPLLAFTRTGGRLGYGGGYYDRTLEALRANAQSEGDILAVGFAYGVQEVDALPLEPLDQPLDWVVTERGAFKT